MLKVDSLIVVAGKGYIMAGRAILLYTTKASAQERVHLLYTHLKVRHLLINILPLSFWLPSMLMYTPRCQMPSVLLVY